MNLTGFRGTTEWHRFSKLFPNFLLTDGALYVATYAEAFWLFEAIASHQMNPKIRNCEMCQEIQFWRLEVKENKSCVLTCARDLGEDVLEQKISYTDFPLKQIKLYCQRSGSYWVIMLPTEY